LVDLSVRGADNSAVYNGATQTNSGATTVGLTGTDAVTITGYASGKNVGTYTDNLTLTALGSTDLSNYQITTTQGHLTITRAPLSVTGTTGSLVYSGSAQTNTAATITGLKGSDAITVTGYGTGTNVGTFADNLQVAAGAGTLLSNYSTPTITNGSLSITQAPLSIAANNVTSTYGTSVAFNNATGFTPTGLKGADSLNSVTLSFQGASTGVAGTTAAGTYTSLLLPSAAVAGGSTLLSNYNITYVPGNVVVNRKAISISEAALNTTY